MQEKIKDKLSAKGILTVFAVLLSVVLVFIEIAYRFNVISFSFSEKLLEKFSASAYNDETVLVKFLDVGQGDCTIIKVRDRCAVIDFGPNDDSKKVYKELKSLGIKDIDLAFITHLHKDHIGGFPQTAKYFKIDKIIVNDSWAEDADIGEINKLLSVVEHNKIQKVTPKENMEFSLCDAKIKILYINSLADKENNRSITLLLNIEGRSFLFTGDGEKDNEKELVLRYPSLRVDILKLGHHGSYTSSSENFLKTLKPLVTVASCGYNNYYNHPSEKTVEILEKSGIKYYRTDLDGNIEITFEKEKIFVLTERQLNK